MIGTYAKRLWAPDYPWAPTHEQRDRFLDEIREHWGGPVGLEERAPSLAKDPSFRQWWSTYLRMGASPGAALALTRMNTEVDIRDVLPLVQVPTLVLHRSDDVCLKVEEGRFVASRIEGAKFVELPGADHLPFVGDQEPIFREVEEFLAAVRESAEPDRVLATVLAADFQPPAAAIPFEAHVHSHLKAFQAARVDYDGARLMAAFDGPARAVRCACALKRDALRMGLAARIGLHTGECVLAPQGLNGAAIEVAAQIRELAQPSEVLVSGTLRDLVAGSGIRFQACGRLEAEGAREWQILRIEQV
jgi:hypothetical protein